MSDNIIRHLRVLWRTDKIIAEIRLRHLLVNLGLQAFAALIAAFGLLLFELAAYFALVQSWSAILSAAVLGLFNFVVAAILVLIASKRPVSRELTLATDVHNSAIDALQQQTRSFRHPWEGVLTTLLPTLLPILIKAIRRPKPQSSADN